MYASTTLTAPSYSHQNQNSPYSNASYPISIRMTRPHSLTSPSVVDKAAMNTSIKKVLHKSVCLPCKTNNSNTNNNNNNNPNNAFKPSSSTSSLTMSSFLSASPPKILTLSSSSTLSKSSTTTTTTTTTTILDCSLPTPNAQVLASPATSTVIPIQQTPREGITVSQIISSTKTFTDFVKEEFESLRCQASTCEKNFYSGLLPQNSWKNRYHNVLPLENSRVCLPCVLSSDSDYINANYIYGLFDDVNSSSSSGGNHCSRKPQCPPTYIACQAPLLSTIGDFWKMVWTEKSPVVVCLTKLTEQGTQKADVYWPECEPLRAGNFIVSITKKVVYKSIVVRTFLVKKVEVEDDDMCDFEEYGVIPLSSSSTFSEEKSSKEKRVHEVVHLHFTDWPDFGTPVSTAPIFTLAQLASLLKQKGANRGVNGPITVHCSAGIGRAGTFIATHILLSKYTNMALNTSIHTHSHVHTQTIPHINSPSHQSFPPRGHPIPPVSCVCSSPRLQPSTSAPAIHATSPTHNSTLLSCSSPSSPHSPLQTTYSPPFSPLVLSQNSLNGSTTQMYIPSCPHDFSFSIKDVVRHLRTQRYGMVQTEDQYRFIYRVVAESIRAQNQNEILRRKTLLEDETLGLGGLVLSPNPLNNTKSDKSQPQPQLSPIVSPSTSPVILTNNSPCPLNLSAPPSPLSFANFFVPPPQNGLCSENMVIEEENTLKSSSISNSNNTNGKILVDLLSSRGVHTKTTK